MRRLTKLQNRMLKQGLLIGLLLTVSFVAGAVMFASSSWVTGVGHFKEQPLSFSHETHVNGVGLKCQFCHTGADHAAGADMPTLETCYGCHKEVLANSKHMDPLRQAYQTRESLPFQRVNQVADHVHFNHAAHTGANISCATCHGDIDHMPLVAPEHHFSMEYCLTCHKTQPNAPRLQDCYTCHR